MSAQEKAMSLIYSLDLSYLVGRMQEKYGWAQQAAIEAIRRYKNFLILLSKYRGDPDFFLAPAPDIDEIWHNHILHTREYINDCQVIFGGYMHHAPEKPFEEEEKKESMNLYARQTAALYYLEFDEPYFI